MIHDVNTAIILYSPGGEYGARRTSKSVVITIFQQNFRKILAIIVQITV